MAFRYIDIHAHLNFAVFDADRDEAVRRAVTADTAVINVGTQADTSRKAVEMVGQYEEGVYAIVGLHPTHSDESFDPAVYREFLKNPRVVGIGECGLDYFRLEADTKARQKETFAAQIELANESGKPLMLHVREAYGDALEMLRSQAKVKGNAHFFAGTIEEAKMFLDLGFTISFTGVITFAKQYLELVEYVPLDMIQAETDCPFVTPVPYRGKRNEPAYVSHVVEKIARVKGLPIATVEDALLANARRMWKIEL
ncbi:MAG: TatD family hydrolase [Candidatus Paceibacterota bacterium]